jgi:hypothetical protein
MKVKFNKINTSCTAILLVTTHMATVSTAFSCGGGCFDNPELLKALLQNTIDATENIKIHTSEQAIEKENRMPLSEKLKKPADSSPSAKIALLLYKGEENKANSMLVQTQNAIKKRYEDDFMGSLTASGIIQILRNDIGSKLAELNSSH